MRPAVGAGCPRRQTYASRFDWTFLHETFLLCVIEKDQKRAQKKWQITKKIDVTGQAMTFLFHEQISIRLFTKVCLVGFQNDDDDEGDEVDC